MAITLLQMNYILAVCEERSISRAAEKLRVAQPSISRLIGNIEKEYNVELFYRKTHELELTFAGKMFVDQVKQLVFQYRNLDLLLRDLGNVPQGKLTFGCSSNHITYLLPPLLHKLSEVFPYLEISVVNDNSANLIHQTSQGEIDIMYSHALDQSADLEFVPISKEELVLVVPKAHPLAQRKEESTNWRERTPIYVKELEKEQFILLRKSHSVRILTDIIFKERGISPPVRLESSSNSVAHKLVAEGLGISILPESEVLFARIEPNCIALPLEDHIFSRQLYICYKKALHLTSAVTACVDFVREIVKDAFKNVTIDI